MHRNQDCQDAGQSPRRLVGPEISRFPYKEHAHLPGSMTTPGRSSARDCALAHIAFSHRNDVGAQDEGSIVAQRLVYAYPCQRFAPHLSM